MNKRLIKKGAHRPLFRDIGLYLFKREISFEYIFEKSCAYLRGDEDQLDLNKLHGIGYFPSHHKNSARFAWRYAPEINLIQIFSYIYDRGVRKTEWICDIPIGKKIKASIFIHKDKYLFKVDKDGLSRRLWVNKYSDNKIGYHLGIYVGGGDSSGGKDDTAMHDMVILQKKIK